ncbi:MAG: glycosyltransferase family 2 protein [Gammaproteobacteria bacterium]|nr:glycosyltransferase family 2 protein [Gammaproteobacteria bacterium]
MVSIVMPAYNECDIIEASVREWHDEVAAKLAGAEIVVVDDRSADGTGAVLDALATKLPTLRVVRPERNGGHGKAVRLGLQEAKNDFVFQTDSDRQHVPAEFWKLWEVRGENDFVFGVRRERKDGLFRVFVTRSMRLLNFVVWGQWITDANCPFKLMRRHPLRQVLAKIPPDSFIPMVILSILARRMKFRVAEVQVTHLPRTGGTQSLKGMVRWARVAYRCSRELVRVRLGT